MITNPAVKGGGVKLTAFACSFTESQVPENQKIAKTSTRTSAGRLMVTIYAPDS